MFTNLFFNRKFARKEIAYNYDRLLGVHIGCRKRVCCLYYYSIVIYFGLFLRFGKIVGIE